MLVLSKSYVSKRIDIAICEDLSSKRLCRFWLEYNIVPQTVDFSDAAKMRCCFVETVSGADGLKKPAKYPTVATQRA